MTAKPNQFPPQKTGTPAQENSRLIRGTGEMADLVRARNWSETALGPIYGWSESLHCSVNLMLSCQFPTVIFWGPEMIQLYNDAYLPLMAEKHPKALGQAAPECWEEAWHIIGPQIDATLRQGKTICPKNVLVPVTRGGQIRDVYWTYSYSPIYENSGSIGGVLIVCHDVTEEIGAKRDRDAFAERLNQVLGATTDAIVSLNREWQITYVNPRAKEILAPSGDVLGLNLWEIFPHIIYEDSPYVEHCHRAMDKGVAGDFEAFYPEPLNIWLEAHVRPTKDGIAIFFRDITAQRQTEIGAREAAARLDAMYSTSLEYIGLLSTDGKILDCNRASLEFAGNTRQEVLGLYFWESPWFRYTAGAPELVRQAIGRAVSGEHIRRELPLQRPAGEIIMFDFSISPVRDATGEVIFLVPEGHDITLVKRTEAALIQSEKLAAVGRLAASIAHEINNPLESVTNLLYLSLRSRDLAEIQKLLESAERELRRVSVISNQTLRFYRQSTKPKLVPCDELIDSVLSIHQGRILNSGIQVEARHRAKEPLRCFDGEIRQVLNNLISNAIDAMRSKGGRLLVRSREGTHMRTGKKGLVLTVADTGSGIDREHLKKIFEPFFTTKGIQGTGLGLWVSQEIVARHQGSLRVRSSGQPGSSGTVFSLFLPFEGIIEASVTLEACRENVAGS